MAFRKEAPTVQHTPAQLTPVSPRPSLLENVGQVATGAVQGLGVLAERRQQAQKQAAIEEVTQEVMFAADVRDKASVPRTVQEEAGSDQELRNAQRVSDRLHRHQLAEEQRGSRNGAEARMRNTVMAAVAEGRIDPMAASEIFRQQTGRPLGASIVAEEEAIAEQKAAQQAAHREWLQERAEAFGVYDPRLSTQQLEMQVSPYLDRYSEMQRRETLLSDIQNADEIDERQHKAAERDYLRSGMGGAMIDATQQITELRSAHDFDPTTASPEQRIQLVQELQQLRGVIYDNRLRNIIHTPGGEARSRLDETVGRVIDNEIAFVNGEITQEQYDRSRDLGMAVAKQRLYENPDYREAMLKLEELENIPSELFRSTDLLQVGSQVALPALEALMVGTTNPEMPAYRELRSRYGEEDAVEAFRMFRHVWEENIDNPDTLGNMGELLDFWSNGIDSNPENVPTSVLDDLMGMAADPRILDVIAADGGQFFDNNYSSVMQTYMSRMQREMGRALSMNMERVIERPAGQADRGTAGALGMLLGARPGSGALQAFTGRDVQRDEQVRLIDIVDLERKENGMFEFRAIDQFQDNPEVQQQVRRMNRAYAKPLGQLVRTNAHLRQGDEDYERSWNELLGTDEFSAVADTTVREDLRQGGEATTVPLDDSAQPEVVTQIEQQAGRTLTPIERRHVEEKGVRPATEALTGQEARARVEEEIGRELNAFEERLVELEGFADFVYLDTKLIPTTGLGQIGDNMDLSPDTVVDNFVQEAREQINDFDSLPENVQVELVQAAYRGDLRGSPTFRTLFNEGRYAEAAEEFLRHDEYLDPETSSGIKRRLEAVRDAVLTLEESQ